MRHDRKADRSSSAAIWAPLAKGIAPDSAIGVWASRRRSTLVAYEFVRFGVKQAWACLFGALMLGLLIITHLAYPKGATIPRYDALLVGAVIIQAGMLYFRLETRDEAAIILVFHVVGTIMEIFKTSAGSWSYPEPSVFRIAGVPLFTGFMYAAIGSYIARCWRLFDLRFTRHPPLWTVALLASAIYANFFAHHFVPDMRIALFSATVLLFARTWIHFKVWRTHRRMPLLVGFGLVALFIWFAENIGTFTAAWVYPSQKAAWHMVSSGKLGAWFLLMIISYALVAALHGIAELVDDQEDFGNVSTDRLSLPLGVRGSVSTNTTSRGSL